MFRSVVLIALVSCTRYAPAPVAPSVEPALIDTFLAKTPVGKCERWGSDEKRLCNPSPTKLVWCVAPANGDKPRCEMALDWTPQPNTDSGSDPKE